MDKTTFLFTSGVLMACTLSLQAQVNGYIPGDENYTQTLQFHNIDTLLVVVPHNYSISDQEKTDIENYVFWDQYQKKPVYVYKRETELTKKDELRNLQFYGPFCEFQLAEVQNIPFKQVDGGFLFNGEVFANPADAFFYINDEATRLYTCRNSTQAWHQYANFAAGYFPLYIFRGIDLYLSGYWSSVTCQPRVNSIPQMRQSYFETIATRHFDFQLAKSICSDSLRSVILEQAEKSLETLCASLETDTAGLGRMTTYVYSSMTDLQQFLSMSPRMTIYGKSFGAVNHVSTFDMSVFNHELAHTVIGNKIGVQSNSFFCEGFAVYTGYTMADNSYDRDLDSIKTHLDLLTEDIITGPDNRFYSIPHMYPISGVFTKFIIGKVGMETFKALYAQPDIENAFRDKGLPLADLIAEFKSIIDNSNPEN
ncbi:MAG: hypothetical protein R6W81_11285 [Bacteroidales bacterium]